MQAQSQLRDPSKLWHSMQSDKLTAHAKTSMFAFTLAVRQNFTVNWHHRVLCSYLDKFVRREITRLMIFLPPQCSKSELSSRLLPAYVFGRDPNHRFTGTTYGNSFAAEFNIDVQRIMESERYKEIFPNTRLPDGEQGYVRTTSRFDIVGHRGRYNSVGTLGSLVGKTANTLVIDDPVKSAIEADSTVYRERLFRWANTGAKTRLMPTSDGKPPGILFTTTRWHEDGLEARMLAIAKANPSLPQWTVVSFPALREDMENALDPRELDEPLWSSMHPRTELDEIRLTDSRSWSALYQQRPSPQEGNLIKRDWFKFYTVVPDHLDLIIQSWDLTYKDGAQNDFAVGQVWGRKGASFYLLAQIRQRMGFTAQAQAIRNLAGMYPLARGKYIEEAANGAAVIEYLRKEVPGIIAVKPKGSKIARLQAVSPLMQAGNVHLPDPSIAPWIGEYMEELCVFPNGKHDDQVDSTTQALDQLSSGMRTDFMPLSLSGVSKWSKV